MRALNGVGWGPYSANTSVTADSIPGVMTAPVLGAIHPYNATINWVDLTSPTNGGASCTFYLLQWYDYTASAWTNLTVLGTTGLVLTYTHVPGYMFSPT